VKDKVQKTTSRLSISQFAKFCGTTRQTLQYYDKIGLLRPALTGEQGYRYYKQHQSYDFRFIATLKSMGCTLDEIKLIIESPDDNLIFTVLSGKKKLIEEEIGRLEASRKILEKAEYLFKFNRLMPDYPVAIDIETDVVVTRFAFDRLVELESDDYRLERTRVSELCRSLSFAQLHPSGFVVPREEFLSGRRRFSHMFFLVHDFSLPDYFYTVPAGRFIVYKTYVNYPFTEDRNAAYDRLDDFIKRNGFEIAGDVMDISIKTPRLPRSNVDIPILIFVPIKGN
jgi:DNA-binding transcriptional MerR regulator